MRRRLNNSYCGGMHHGVDVFLVSRVGGKKMFSDSYLAQ